MRRSRVLVTVWALAVALLASQAPAGSVRLSGSAFVRADAPVTLADVARLDGAAAEALAGTVLVEDPDTESGARGWFELPVERVRELLRAESAASGRLAVSGAVCVIRLRGVGEVETVRAEPEPDEPEPETLSLEGPETVRRAVASELARLYAAEPGDVRVLFERSDREFLDTKTWGRRVFVRPVTSGSSARAVLDVRIYSGTDVIASRRVRADVSVRRTVVVLTGERDRHERLRRNDLSLEPLWIDPSGEPTLRSLDDAAGQRARRPLAAGTVLRTGDLETPIVIRRGELVTVECVSGGVNLQAKGRALADGRPGETIECRLLIGEESFTGRVEGPGRVVVMLD